MRTETLLLMDMDISTTEEVIRRDIQKWFPDTETKGLKIIEKIDRLGNTVNAARVEVICTDAVKILW